MKKRIRNCVWYTITLSVVIFTITIFVVLGQKANYVIAALAACIASQLFGLLYYLHGKPNDQPSKGMRVILFLCRLSVLGVAACCLIAVYSLSNQYHNHVTPMQAENASDNITTIETDDLYILYPEYTTVELTLSKRPPRKDGHVTFCCSAACQKDYSLSFSYDKICGSYASHGEWHQGYEDGPMGAFAYYDGTFHFANIDEAEKEVQTAAEKGGCAFHQFLVIYDGEAIYSPVRKSRCFRILTELDGKLCIIDAKKPCSFDEFTSAVIKLGVTRAIYLDMGSGWNYSWYRDNRGTAKTLIGLPWPFSHNWLTFIK